MELEGSEIETVMFSHRTTDFGCRGIREHTGLTLRSFIVLDCLKIQSIPDKRLQEVEKDLWVFKVTKSVKCRISSKTTPVIAT